jgi:ketosteroid isomerase-like protein
VCERPRTTGVRRSGNRRLRPTTSATTNRLARVAQRDGAPGRRRVRRADLGFFEALLDRDIRALEVLLADEFMIVDVGSGSVHPRAAFLEAISGRMVTFQEITTFPDEAVIRLAGRGTGIVIGRTAMSFSDAEGALIEVASRYTHVFQTDGRKWQLVSAQGTPISSTASAR